MCASDRTYTWEFVENGIPEGSAAILADLNTPTPFFTTDELGTYTIQLIVKDEQGIESEPDIITISSNNIAPTAKAGSDQIAIVGDTVSLIGEGYDPESDLINYEWNITSLPEGSTSSLSNRYSVNPTFIPDLIGDYTIKLTVSDFVGPGSPDIVTVSVISGIQYLENKYNTIISVVNSLVKNQITSNGNRMAFIQILKIALNSAVSGEYIRAVEKTEDMLNRVNGCVVDGNPDGNGPGRDWVVDCSVQGVLVDELNDVLVYLRQQLYGINQ